MMCMQFLKRVTGLRHWLLMACCWALAACGSASGSGAAVVQRIDLLPHAHYALQADGPAPSDRAALDAQMKAIAQRLQDASNSGSDLTQAGFKRLSDRPALANFGFVDQDLWLYAPLVLPSSIDGLGYVVQLPYAPLDHVHVWALDALWRTVATDVSGDQIPFAQRAVANREHVFRLNERQAGRAVHLLVRVRSSGVTEVSMRTWSAPAFEQHSQSGYLGYAMFLGLGIGLCAFNFLLWLFVREARFGWYAAFAGFTTLTQLALSGLGFQYVWPESLAWQNRAVAASMAACGFFASMFARSYLRTYRRSPFWDRALLLVALLALASMLTVWVAPLRGVFGGVVVLVGRRGGDGGAQQCLDRQQYLQRQRLAVWLCRRNGVAVAGAGQQLAHGAARQRRRN
jgi:two-component system, sensor histidine kinase LadS